MTWTKRFAAWAEVDHADGETAQRRAVDLLQRHLAKDGAVPISEMFLQVSDTHADHFMRSKTMILASVVGLVLRIPNPMPRVRLFRWLPG